MAQLPTIRWGIVATGLISTWFVEDLLCETRDAPKVEHVIQAIGSSSLEKGQSFAKKVCPESSPNIYGSYEGVYADPNVDIVYIGTPHAFHRKNCLDAIAAGKAVLCEKAFTLNAREAREVFDAAGKKGVYVAEAMWLRHRPLVRDLQDLVHRDKVIGDVFRVVSNYGLEKDIPNLPEGSRYKEVELGAGSLLDLGIYSLTWALVMLDPKCPAASERPDVLAAQTHWEGVEVTSSIILRYPETGRQAMVGSTTMSHSIPDTVAAIQGTSGYIVVHGPAVSLPESITIHAKVSRDEKGRVVQDEGKTVEYKTSGRGYRHMADNCALDVLAGRQESSVMPWSETIRVMEMMDEIRRQGGTVYPVDSE